MAFGLTRWTVNPAAKVQIPSPYRVMDRFFQCFRVNMVALFLYIYFFIILYVNCLGRTMLYMCPRISYLGQYVSCERSGR